MIRALAGLSAAVAILMVFGLAVGDYSVSSRDLLTLLLRPSLAPPHIDMIVVDLRLPRLLMSALVGIALAVAGTISQAIMRNPLAEPGLLGINAGAAFAVMTLFVAMDNAPMHLTPLVGFFGASAMVTAIYALSWKRGTSSLRIILIGIGMSSFAGAATTLLSTFGAIADVQRALIWLAGSVYHADWNGVKLLAVWLLPSAAVAFASSRQLDLIRLGDPIARGLGQHVSLVGMFLIVLCTVISGAAVATAGLVGFVGLIAPHLARRLVGPMHRQVIPVSALIGALLVMSADLAGRTIMAPVQLPAGIVTALVGAPFLGFLLWKYRHAAA